MTNTPRYQGNRVHTAEDGTMFVEGARLFSYYTMKIGVVGTIDNYGWFTFKHEDGTTCCLNGERLCSISTAYSKGWTTENPASIAVAAAANATRELDTLCDPDICNSSDLRYYRALIIHALRDSEQILDLEILKAINRADATMVRIIKERDYI